MGISNGSRKLVGISLFIFWAAVTAILAAGLLFYQNNNNPDNSGSVAGFSLPKSGVKEITLDLQEIAKHSATSDCWMSIDGKVYNFTSYLGVHPGSAVSTLPYCGKDGSQAFATKDQNNPKTHSDYARSLFANYYIGDLNQKINQSQTLPIDQSPSPSANISTPTPVPSAPLVVSNSNITLNAQEIAKHNLAKDCWLIINSKIYNVTNYLGTHPGGVSAIAPYCGKEATQVFTSLPHSLNANSLLSGYYIGNLNQTSDAQQIQQNIQNTAQITPLPRRGGDDKDDD